MWQLPAILAPAASTTLQLSQTQVACAHSGTKHSISTSDITAVSSAVSACAINSVAERADCLCRKYLTLDPKPSEKYLFFLFFLRGSGEPDICQCINHDIWVFAHACLVILWLFLSLYSIFCKSVMYYVVLYIAELMIDD